MIPRLGGLDRLTDVLPNQCATLVTLLRHSPAEQSANATTPNGDDRMVATDDLPVVAGSDRGPQCRRLGPWQAQALDGNTCPFGDQPLPRLRERAQLIQRDAVLWDTASSQALVGQHADQNASIEMTRCLPDGRPAQFVAPNLAQRCDLPDISLVSDYHTVIPYYRNARIRGILGLMDEPGLPRVAILDDYQGVALQVADWSRINGKATPVLFREPLGTEDEVVNALRPFPIVVAMRERTAFPRSTLRRLPEMKLLVTTGARNSGIDLEATRDLGITVCGTGGSGADAAELTWALILASARRLDVEFANIRAGGWMTTVGSSLSGRTLGVVGLGRLGKQVARVGLAFGMHVTAWSHNLTAERCQEVGVEFAPSLERLLAASDVVTIHLVLSERTRGLIGEAELRLMKPHAWLINTSRGPICNEGALARACDEGWIAGAALDVFAHEPLPSAHQFRLLHNVLATPHIGYVTDRAYQGWFADVIEDIAAFLDGTPIRVLCQGGRAER